MDLAEIILALLNLSLGFGFAIHLAKLLNRVTPEPKRFIRFFILFVGIYFLECVAIVAAMLLPLFSLGLAFVWGLIFGLWLREYAPAHKILKTSFYISLYSSFPAASFILVPVMGLFKGWDVLSAEDGIRFGIPDALYWPFNTILGFYAVISFGLFILKPVITTGIVSLLIHLKGKPDNR
jgi:hypothetical protein